MKIQIKDRLYLESDDMQFVIKRYNETPNPKNGELGSTAIGYYPRVEQAMNAVVNLLIRQSDATTFEKLVSDVADIRAMIASKIDF